MDRDAEAQRIRALILLKATCETVLTRLDEDDPRNGALIDQTAKLGATLNDELTRFASRRSSWGE